MLCRSVSYTHLDVYKRQAKKQDMPKFLARENANQVPAAALLMSSLMVQLIVVATLFSADAFAFALSLTCLLYTSRCV